MFCWGQLAVHVLAILLGRNEVGISNRGKNFLHHAVYQLGLLPTIQSNLIISLNCAYVPEVSCSRRGRRDCDSAAPRPALSAAPPGTCDAHGGDARPPPPSTSASPASPLAGSPGRKWLPGSAGVAAAGACGRAGVHSLWLCELTASHLCNCKVDR